MKYRSCSLALALAALGGVTASGCSSSSGAPAAATVAGTFAGQAVQVADSAGFQGTNGQGAYLGVELSSAPGVCKVAQQNATMASTSVLSLLVVNVGAADAPALLAGSYAITNGAPAETQDAPSATSGGAAPPAPSFLAVSATYDEFDANCLPTLAPTATSASSGTITVDTVSAALVAGSFDLHFPSGDHLTGRFSSPVCGNDEAVVAAPTNGAPENTTMQAAEPAMCVQ
jgi:hypothetical protein